MSRSLLAIALLGWAIACSAAYDATSAHGIDLSGSWLLNKQLSDDAERLLDERLQEERERYSRWRRQEEAMRPPGAPPDINTEPEQPRQPSEARRLSQKRRAETLHRMLAISPTLEIRQNGSDVEIVSEVESRRVVAGSHTQVSMPEGQLADSRVGWDGQWFVIERKSSRGPRVTEKLRLLKTGQLEYLMAWSGDTEVAGLKIRRVYDRRVVPVAAPDPNLGPTR